MLSSRSQYFLFCIRVVLFQWLSILSGRGGEVFVFKLETIRTAYLALRPLAKRELVVRWEMGNQQQVVNFLIDQGFMEVDEMETIGPLFP